jgi:hypothetical protein
VAEHEENTGSDSGGKLPDVDRRRTQSYSARGSAGCRETAAIEF